MSGTIKEAHLSLADKALRYFCWDVVHTVQRPKVCGGKPAHDGPTIYEGRLLPRTTMTSPASPRSSTLTPSAFLWTVRILP